ncbi:MAG: thiS [Chthonomonadaceae bacterium]|nr:thiS [Chthonomonadaceae bacterium]
MIELTINGEARSLPHAMALSAFLEAHGLHEKRVVVERNREIVSRHTYAEVVLQAGDELEIVQMMAGG